jgi:predicted nucleotidyltransferase
VRLTDFPAIISRLSGGAVEYVIVGGVAATLHGSIEGTEFRYVTLRRLILLKRAAGRAKDLNMIGELEALLEEQERDR